MKRCLWTPMSTSPPLRFGALLIDLTLIQARRLGTPRNTAAATANTDCKQKPFQERSPSTEQRIPGTHADEDRANWIARCGGADSGGHMAPGVSLGVGSKSTAPKRDGASGRGGEKKPYRF